MRMRSPSFVAQYQSVFLDEEYWTPTETSSPRILDLGANVGMACWYFRLRYPDAQIVAFEADPDIYALLKENVAGLEIEAYNLAAWTEDTTLSFKPDGLGGGAITAKGDVSVDAIDLGEWLSDRNFDLIKMDIEGAEHFLIPHIVSRISTTRHFIFEYHSVVNEPQHLDQLLSTLSEAGFRYQFKDANNWRNPWRSPSAGAFDDQMVVYCSR